MQQYQPFTKRSLFERIVVVSPYVPLIVLIHSPSPKVMLKLVLAMNIVMTTIKTEHFL
jgi:hypothetical protein